MLLLCVSIVDIVDIVVVVVDVVVCDSLSEVSSLYYFIEYV